jgi:hypothetical protein
MRLARRPIAEEGFLPVAYMPTQSRADEIMGLCSLIRGFAELRQDWNGKDTLLPDHKVIKWACNLVAKLPPSVGLPQVSPSAEGEIGLSWFNGGKRLEAMLQPDRHLVWVKKVEDEFVPGDDIDLEHEHSFDRLFEDVEHLYA